LVGLSWHHPALSADERQEIETLIMPELEARLSSEEIQAGMEKGRDLDLDEVVDAFLAGAT
jgi:hypothetical protein